MTTTLRSWRLPLLGALIGILAGSGVALVSSDHYVAQATIPVSVAPGVDTQATDPDVLSRQVAIAAATVTNSRFPKSAALHARLTQTVPDLDAASLGSVEIFAYARTNLVAVRVAGRSAEEATQLVTVAAASLADVLNQTRVGPITIKPARFTDLPVRTTAQPRPPSVVGRWGYHRSFYPFAGALAGVAIVGVALNLPMTIRQGRGRRAAPVRRIRPKVMAARLAVIVRRPVGDQYRTRGCPVFRARWNDLPAILAAVVLVIAAGGAGGRFISIGGIGGFALYAAVICLIGALLIVIRRRGALQVVGRLGWLVGGVAWAGCSVAWSSDPLQSFKTWLVLGLLLSSGVLLDRIARSSEGRWDMSGLILTVVSVLSAVSVVMIVAFPQWGIVTDLISADGSSEWNVGLYAWNSALGVAAGLAAVIAFGGLIVKVGSPWLWAGLLVNLVAVGVSKSATAVLALVAGVAIMSMITWVRARWVGGAAVVLWMVLLVVPFHALDWVLGLVGRTADLTGRVPIWEATLAQTDPVRFSGLGLGMSPDLEPFLGAVVPHSHNGYLEILSELGVFGLLLFAAALIAVIRRVVLHGGSTIVGVLVFFLVANIANNYIIGPTLLALVLGWLSGVGIPEDRPATQFASL